MHPTELSESSLEALKQYDTCILADAVETFDIRPRNQGYTRPGLHPLTVRDGLVVGYAATARVRSSDIPMLGHSYLANTGWWAELERLPKPRIAVLQDIDHERGVGACVGQMACSIFKTLDCRAVVTNGAVRNLAALAAASFPVFAACVSPSHSYAHLIDHSQRVEIFGLIIQAGDLLAADRHGVLSIPPGIAGELPRVADELLQRKRRFIEFCGTDRFSLDRLAEEIKKLEP